MFNRRICMPAEGFLQRRNTLDTTRTTKTDLHAAFLLLYMAGPVILASVYTLEWMIGRMTGTAVYPYPWPVLAAMGVLSAPVIFLLCLEGRFCTGLHTLRMNRRVPLASAVLAVALIILIWKPAKLGGYFDSEHPGSAPYPWRGVVYLTGMGLLELVLGTTLYLTVRNWRVLAGKSD